MNRSHLCELSLLESLLSKTCLFFDEDKCRAGDEVVWLSRNICEDTCVDVMSGLTIARLKEDDLCASLRNVTISDVDSETLVLKPDNFGRQYFKKNTYNKACDYLILTRWNGTKYALFIDLKTKIHETPLDGVFRYELSDKDKEMAWQMIGADNLFDSLIVTLERQKGNHKSATNFWGQMASSALMSYERRYLIMYMGINIESGSMVSRQTTPVQRPLTSLLQKPIHAFDVNNDCTMSLGCLFARGLER